MSVEDDIKHGNIANIYLFYGKEAYKKRNYKELLKKAVLGDGSLMNYNYFEGENIDFNTVYDSVVTLPFFSDKRLVIVENSGIFSNSRQIESDDASKKDLVTESIIDNIPESTCLAFIENSAAKNKRLYKKILTEGVVIECNSDSERDIKQWLAKGFKQVDKKVRESTLDLLISMAGTDYDRLKCEYEKIIAYTGNREIVTDDDIKAVVSAGIESKIFVLIDAMTQKHTKTLLREYYNLLLNRESPMYIMAMIRRQFKIMLQVGDLSEFGLNTRDISSRLGMKEYPVKKALSYMRFFNTETIEKNLDLIADTEYKIKSGDLADQTGVELLLLEFVMN